MSDEQQVSVSRVIDATPEQIFLVLSDPTKHPVIDGSGTVKGESFGPDTLTAVGETFGMKMSLHGVPYRMKNTVKEYDENRVIAWAHLGKHRWRYELEPLDGGTNVTETFDWSPAISPKFIEMMGYPKQHKGNMEATLERLDQHLTGS
jgi:hypothetical protein